MQSIGCVGCTNDCSLIRDIHRGNAAAFEQFVYAHGQSDLSLAFRITGSQTEDAPAEL